MSVVQSEDQVAFIRLVLIIITNDPKSSEEIEPFSTYNLSCLYFTQAHKLIKLVLWNGLPSTPHVIRERFTDN